MLHRSFTGLTRPVLPWGSFSRSASSRIAAIIIGRYNFPTKLREIGMPMPGLLAVFSQVVPHPRLEHENPQNGTSESHDRSVKRSPTSINIPDLNWQDNEPVP
uniref:Cell death-inducing p53-target protein 1 homolog n=1 Tax=Schistocephalus solidus TaxID=70667 RepID=A0A0X3PTD0_SCHSO